jgi:hypothetical protein
MRGDSESLADQLAEGILEDRFESAAEEFINSLVDILISIPVKYIFSLPNFISIS